MTAVDTQTCFPKNQNEDFSAIISNVYSSLTQSEINYQEALLSSHHF